MIARSVERKARWKKNGSASSTTCPGAGLGTCFGSDNTESIEKRVPYKDMGRWQQVSAHTPVTMLHMLCLFSHVFASLQVSSGWRNALSSVRRRSLLLHILSLSANAKQICSPACSLRMHVGWQTRPRGDAFCASMFCSKEVCCANISNAQNWLPGTKVSGSMTR